MNSSKSYAEKIGMPSFPWEFVLTNSKGTSRLEIEEMIARSDDWKTCACSALDARLPRTEVGMPIDKELRRLEGFFNHCIRKLHISSINYSVAAEASDRIKLKNDMWYRRKLAWEAFASLKEREAQLLNEIEKRSLWTRLINYFKMCWTNF